jgi:hypothetical protein
MVAEMRDTIDNLMKSNKRRQQSNGVGPAQLHHETSLFQKYLQWRRRVMQDEYNDMKEMYC